jgi:dihydroorotate dehydrogenase (NAD+) catalytic subunit
MLNAISLENVGVEAFLRDKLPALPRDIAVLASVFGTSIEAYTEVCQRLDGAPGVAGIELNASCPHVKAGGIEFGQSADALGRLVRACRAATRMPLLVKLSPNVTSIADMARVCEAEGADGVSLINSVQGMMVDVHTRRPRLSNVLGGLSGPAILPIALRMVYQVARAVKIPVCGIGGIATGEDAVAFLLCGASAVQVGTLTYANPRAVLEVRDGIAAYCAAHGVTRVRDLIGALEVDSPRAVSPDASAAPTSGARS